MVGRVSRVSRFALLVSKFRGCLVAAGSDTTASPSVVDVPENHTGLPLTDILRCVGQSLLRSRGFDGDDMASGFRSTVKPPRIEEESEKVASNRETFVHADQSTASGAVFCGIPVAMYFYGDQSRAVEVTLASADLTIRHHLKHPIGPTSEKVYAGAVLHCLALQLAFQFDPVRPLNVELFIDQLTSDVKHSSIERHSIIPPAIVDYDRSSCICRLQSVRQTIRAAERDRPTVSEAVAAFDGDVVSTAIYAFLDGQLQRHSNNDNQEALIEYVARQTSAVTSTPLLAQLASGLTGAFLGIESVPASMRRRCAEMGDIMKLADNFALQYETQPSVYDRPEIGSLSRRQ